MLVPFALASSLALPFGLLSESPVSIASANGSPKSTLSTSSTSSASPLRSERLYHGFDRPTLIVIDDEAGENLTLMLLEYSGQVIVPEYRVEAGQTIDLNQEFPIIRRLRMAAYLQLLRDGEPYGSALVIQPLLSRPPIWTQKEFRPETRMPYTRIVGWGSEPPEGWRRPKPRVVEDEESPPRAVPPDELEDRAPQIEPEVMSGFRIYPERDVILRTTHGDLHIALTPEEAPNTVWNFLHLAEGGFYDDVSFHRIVPVDRHGRPFVIQAGDPSGTGSGGPGYWLPIEPSIVPHDFGVISMARADDPDSAGSQFFICLSRDGTSRLDGQYCAFGFVVQGAQVIRRIAEVELEDAAAGRPKEPPVIMRAEVVPAPPRRPDAWRWEQRVRPADDVQEVPLRVPR